MIQAHRLPTHFLLEIIPHDARHAILIHIILPDWPGNSSSLNETQTFFAQKRLVDDASVADINELEESSFDGFTAAVRDSQFRFLGEKLHSHMDNAD